jgi:hypothetical protein
MPALDQLRGIDLRTPPGLASRIAGMARAEAWLHEALAGWQEKYSDVVVQPEVIREYPTRGLVIASTIAVRRYLLGMFASGACHGVVAARPLPRRGGRLCA